MSQKLFIVGRKDPEPRAWEFIGVFDDEQKAIAACITDDHCVCPAVLNENVETGTGWPGAWYPRLQEKPQ
jgi:hypothetical protein